jgi:hypothetical protein
MGIAYNAANHQQGLSGAMDAGWCWFIDGPYHDANKHQGIMAAKGYLFRCLSMNSFNGQLNMMSINLWQGHHSIGLIQMETIRSATFDG